MNIYDKPTAIIVGTFLCGLLVTMCDNPEPYKQTPPPPQKMEQPSSPPPNPMADNPFIHTPPPPPVAPLGNKTLPAKMNYIGENKMNEAWSMHIWRDEANRVTCYFAQEINKSPVMSCVRDEK